MQDGDDLCGDLDTKQAVKKGLLWHQRDKLFYYYNHHHYILNKDCMILLCSIIAFMYEYSGGKKDSLFSQKIIFIASRKILQN